MSNKDKKDFRQARQYHQEKIILGRIEDADREIGRLRKENEELTRQRDENEKKWLEVAEGVASLKLRVQELESDLASTVDGGASCRLHEARLRDKHYRECEEIAKPETGYNALDPFDRGHAHGQNFASDKIARAREWK